MPNEESLFDAIAKLLPKEQRERFYRRMSHLRTLNPSDEILVICEAMGFLALIIRETPDRMASQRVEIERAYEQSIRNIHEVQQAVLDFHRKLETRIGKLPLEIENGFDSEKIASRIGEKLRESLVSTGLPETAEGLRRVADDLRFAMNDFSGVASAMSHPQGGALPRLKHAVGDMEKRLESTMERIDTQLRRLTWSMFGGVVVLCLASIVVGIVLGVLWSHSLH